MEVVLESIGYVDKNKKSYLEDINLKFSAGHVYGIIGNSGSGKSYLGKLLALKEKQTCGEISYDDITIRPYSKKAIKETICTNIGYVPENTKLLFKQETVYDELKHQMEVYHYQIEKVEKRIADVLKMVGLKKEKLSQDPKLLSTGEQRKLAIALALIHNPKILILDEPILGFDPFEQKRLLYIIHMLKSRYQKTIVLITNNLEFLIQAVDEIAVLNCGKLVAFDKKYTILKEARKLKKLGMEVPTTIYFSDFVLKKKKIKIGYRDQMNDLIKDIYRNASWGVKHYK